MINKFFIYFYVSIYIINNIIKIILIQKLKICVTLLIINLINIDQIWKICFCYIYIYLRILDKNNLFLIINY